MATPRTTKRQFLTNLKKSGLFSSDEFDQLLSSLSNSPEGGNVALELIKSGVLTRFQAEQLFAGNTRGLVIGQYALLRPLGKGGLGRVYKAVHKPMDRIVALKVLSPRLISTDKARELFQREVLAIGRMVHPNIVTAFDANMLGESCYLVMEYIDGPDLEKLVRSKGPIRYNIACEIIRQAALGLQYAHELGMLHRDIKPANILVQRNPNNPKNPWEVKLVDFGLARLQSTSDEPAGAMGTILMKDNTIMGTPDYLSPEQSKDLHEVDIRSDLYSLGCTLYFLLTGKVPFPGGSSLEKLIRHATKEPRSISELAPKVPQPVVRMVERLMAKDPDKRYQSPGELALDLAQYSISAAKSKLFIPPRTDEHPVLNPSQIEQSEYETDPNNSGSPQTDTVPQSDSPTPLPKNKKIPSPQVKDDQDNSGHSSRGLIVALCMVIFILLIALILSYI